MSSAGPSTLQATTADLVTLARTLMVPGERRLLGIVGTPGAGKSTLCAALTAGLGDQAALVPMDGFHLANQELLRLGRRGHKGAPDTFDADGYAALLGRLRRPEGRTSSAPIPSRRYNPTSRQARPAAGGTR